MTTFSQLVDSMVSELRRPDLSSEIRAYANQTVRELHFSQDKNAMQLYGKNYRELVLTTTSDSAFTWEVPNPATLQKIDAVKYMDVWTQDGKEVWPEFVIPGRHLRDKSFYYYQVGNTFVFSGAGGAGARIAIGYYRYPASLHYFAEGRRPAWIDYVGWNYAEEWVQTEESRLEAQALVTNWLIESWEHVVAEGIRSKVYKRLSDTERARTSYSLYSQMRQHVVTAELAAGGIS